VNYNLEGYKEMDKWLKMVGDRVSNLQVVLFYICPDLMAVVAEPDYEKELYEMRMKRYGIK
jgi:hypothetical protein